MHSRNTQSQAKMNKTPHPAGFNRLLCAAVAIAVAAAILSPLPVTAYKRQPHPQVTLKPKPEAANDAPKDCFITDKNGRKWPCSRVNNPAAKQTSFECPVENRLGAQMNIYCDDEIMDYIVGPGETEYQSYASVFDPAPPPIKFTVERTSPKVTCQWWCAGNSMSGVVVWDEQWPEAWSCRKDGGDGQCRLVFESNREVVLVTRAGRRVLGDVAVKECSKNWGGYGGWLPFGLGCTYPKHDHPYYGTVN